MALTGGREENLAAIFLKIARNARKKGLLSGIAARIANLFVEDEQDVKDILSDPERGPRSLLRALPRLARGEWADRWREGLRPIFADLVSAYDREADRQMGVGLAFDLSNPYIQEWLDQMSVRLSGQVPETTRKNVERELREGIANGDSIPAITKRIEKVFGQAKRSRAETIARSESHSAQQAASFLQAAASGIIKTKTWHTARDERVREEHRDLEGMTIPLHDEFPNGEGRWPSAVNCRCVLTYGVDMDALTPPEETEESA